MVNSCMHGAVKVMHLIHGFSCYFHFQEKQHRRPFLRWMWKLMYFRPHQIRPCWAGLTQVNGLNVLITLFAACCRGGLGLCLNICYSAIFTKTSRISRIFNHNGRSKLQWISPSSQLCICSGRYHGPPSPASVQVDISVLLALHLLR